MRLSGGTIEELCQRLRDYDPGIVEIVQFGSSVYAPDLARDLDLLVFTKEKKGDQLDYLGALDGVALPHDVDMIVHQTGESLKGLTLGILGANKILYGEGIYLKASTEDFDPSFDEAWAALETGKGNLKMGLSEKNSAVKDRYIRMAFNELAHAARMASLAYLAEGELGWKGIEDGLPSKYRREFEEFFKPLHVEYFYHGNYPMEVEEEFSAWANRVENYVRRLESELGKGAGS